MPEKRRPPDEAAQPTLVAPGAPPPARPRLIARVAVDVSLPHLDRPFDYEVPAVMAADAVVGARVRVRFSGRLRDGFVLSLTDRTDADRLQPLQRVVSPEPVLTPAVARLLREVADHCAGSFADVLRLAVPPRHAATEKAPPKQFADPEPLDGPGARDRGGPFGDYPTGPGLLAALSAGERPRAAWRVVPTAGPSGDWALGLASAAAAAAEAGRGSLMVVPDQRDLDRLAQACADVLGAHAFVVLSADLGPAARYRAFLAAARGQARVVIGTRAAAFAPVRDLGLVAIWDDGDDLFAEPRAPYPHIRDVLAMRSHLERTAVLMAGHARSVEVQSWVEQGWLRDLAAERPAVRRAAPVVRAAADTDRALARDPAARSARLPHDVFTVLRAGLSRGPVLVQVPRAGYLAALVCRTCREPVRCSRCHGPVRVRRADGDAGSVAADSAAAGAAADRPVVECGWCGRQVVDWACEECGDRRWRAPVVGSARTAEELGLAFPQTPVRRSWAGRVLDRVPDEPALVVATPGAEPRAADGYAAAVLLDADQLLSRPDLRAEEEAFRRWCNAVALVRGGADDGTVMIVGTARARAIQALVRLDPDGFAARELADRVAAGFPPAVKYLTLEGSAHAVGEVRDLLRPPPDTELLGPVELPPPPGQGELVRVILRTPLVHASALTRAVKDAVSVRSARKAQGGAVRVRVDPTVIG